MKNRKITTMPKIIALMANASMSATWIIIPLYAKSLGASNFMLGLIGMAYGLLYFTAAYVGGNMADRYCRKKIMHIGLGLSAFAFFLLIFAQTPFQLLFARAFCGFAAGIYPPALISYVIGSKRPIGKFTAYLSLGWALGAYIAGLIGHVMGIFLLSSLLFTAAFAISLILPAITYEYHHVPFLPRSLIRKNLNVYLSYFIRHTGAQSVWVIFPVLLTSYNISVHKIGVIFAINCLMQFTIMQFSDMFKSHMLVILGYIFAALTFGIMYISTSFIGFLISAFTIGVSWGTLYSGSIMYIMERNKEIGTTSGMLQSTISLAGVVGPFIGGTIAELLFLKATVLYAMSCAIVSLMVFVLLSPRK